MLVFITGGWVFKRPYFLVKHKHDCFKIVIQWWFWSKKIEFKKKRGFKSGFLIGGYFFKKKKPDSLSFLLFWGYQFVDALLPDPPPILRPFFGVSPFPFDVCVGCRRLCCCQPRRRRRLRQRQRCGRCFFSFRLHLFYFHIYRTRIPISIRYCFAQPLFCLGLSVFGFRF